MPSKSGSGIVVQGVDKESLFQVLGSQSLYMNRTSRSDYPQEQFIAYCHGWGLFREAQSETTEPVQVHTRQGWRALPAGSVVFVPPFSLLRWRFPQGVLRFEMLYSLTTLPPSYPLVPSLIGAEAFDRDWWQRYGPLKSPQEVAGEKSSLNLGFRQTVSLDADCKANAIAFKARKQIARGFETKLDLGELARSLRVHPSALARYFKQAYGISPVEYRSLLRLMRAQELLLIRKTSVTQAAFECGFDNAAHFSRAFRSFAKCSPRAYCQAALP